MAPRSIEIEEDQRPKVLFFVTEDWYFCLHWLPLATAVHDAGFRVTVLTQVSNEAERIQDAGLHLIPITLSRKGMNPIREAGLLRRLVTVLRAERPDLLHNIAQKPVLYGTLAARSTGVPAIVNTLAGLGFLFTSNVLKARMLRPFATAAYRLLLTNNHIRVTVQNPQDKEQLQHRAGLDATLIRGAGVDLTRFTPSPEPTLPVTVMLASRMLWDKGIREFVDAAKILQQRGRAVRCVLVGKPDDGNPSAVDASRLRSWHEGGAVEWWGFRADMPEVLKQAHIACLPSYREGLPTILIEAAAAGLPLVATDVPGCREVVQPKENGILVPPKDAHALADALDSLIQAPILREQFGRASRTLAEDCFSIQRVAAETLAVYRELLPKGLQLPDSD